MKVTLVFLACLCLAFAARLNVDYAFAKFMSKHNKQYEPEELAIRLSAFKASQERIARLNADARAKGLNTRFAINKFSDLTPEEFKTKFMGYKPSNIELGATLFRDDGSVSIPDALDWRTKGVVTDVKDQQQCGSCWAFSATEGVESAWILAGKGTKDNTILSPQQIVSCDTTDAGCNGGDLPTAFAYIQSSGLEDDADYPYTSGGGDSGTCDYNAQDVEAKITGFVYATQSQNETAMQAAMVNNGPLSICVDAETWQDYSGGVIENGCGTSLDHCVQLVGWDTYTDGTPYWIVRNSWGADWGLSGYLWVERNLDECGIAMEATYVTV